MTERETPVVSMDAITKTFPGVKALDQVRLDLYRPAHAAAQSWHRQ